MKFLKPPAVALKRVVALTALALVASACQPQLAGFDADLDGDGESDDMSYIWPSSDDGTLNTTIDSCSSQIAVSISETEASVTAVWPGYISSIDGVPGYRVDSNGPTELTVVFGGGDWGCVFHAEMSDGVLTTIGGDVYRAPATGGPDLTIECMSGSRVDIALPRGTDAPVITSDGIELYEHVLIDYKAKLFESDCWQLGTAVSSTWQAGDGYDPLVNWSLDSRIRFRYGDNILPILSAAERVCIEASDTEDVAARTAECNTDKENDKDGILVTDVGRRLFLGRPAGMEERFSEPDLRPANVVLLQQTARGLSVDTTFDPEWITASRDKGTGDVVVIFPVALDRVASRVDLVYSVESSAGHSGWYHVSVSSRDWRTIWWSVGAVELADLFQSLADDGTARFLGNDGVDIIGRDGEFLVAYDDKWLQHDVVHNLAVDPVAKTELASESSKMTFDRYRMTKSEAPEPGAGTEPEADVFDIVRIFRQGEIPDDWADYATVNIEIFDFDFRGKKPIGWGPGAELSMRIRPLSGDDGEFLGIEFVSATGEVTYGADFDIQGVSWGDASFEVGAGLTFGVDPIQVPGLDAAELEFNAHASIAATALMNAGVAFTADLITNETTLAFDYGMLGVNGSLTWQPGGGYSPDISDVSWEVPIGAFTPDVDLTDIVGDVDDSRAFFELYPLEVNRPDSNVPFGGALGPR